VTLEDFGEKTRLKICLGKNFGEKWYEECNAPDLNQEIRKHKLSVST
jgi:hypothetical protein